MTKTLCFIPARGGSKRIPRKNLLCLAGKPLLAYTVEVALQAQIFDDVVVSSEDDEILELSTSLGAVPDRRPKALSGDTVHTIQVVEEYLLRQGMSQRYQYIAKMLPTCPLRTVDDMRNAFELFRKQPVDSFVIAVTLYDFPPDLALNFTGDGLTLSLREPEAYMHHRGTQFFAKAYHPNGAIYLATVERFLRERTFFAQPLLGYVMPPERSLDIDYPHQFRIAEYMMQELKEMK